MAWNGFAQDNPEPKSGIGSPSSAGTSGNDEFKELKSNSPFTRSLNLSDSLILTGIARIGGDTIATILDKESKETYVVSGDANPQGWRLTEVEGDQSNLEKVTAKISVNGGEVVSVRFDEKQLKPGEAKPAGGSGGGNGQGRGDGDRRRGPSPEFREMMGKLTEEQRSKLFEKMRELRTKNPNMTREQMGDIFRKTAEKMLGKDK